jgi:alanine dehydrogenase
MEGRVAMIPEACRQLINAGHEVILERGAGALSGYPDERYAALGVELVEGPAELYAAAQLVLKVKEPQPSELALLKADHRLFSPPSRNLCGGCRRSG